MKLKLLALSCCLAAAFTAQAQDFPSSASSDKNYKPTTGDITTEVGFNLNYGISLNGGQIRFRKFNTENKAFRLGASMDYASNKVADNAYQSTFGISIAPGIEKHFAGTNRLSPYIGAELPLGYRASRSESDNHITKGGWSSNTCSQNRGNFNIGVNGLAGVDYYFAPRFYAGFEVGAGIRYRKDKDVVTTYKNDINHTEEQKGYHTISFSPFSSGGLRVGFVF